MNPSDVPALPPSGGTEPSDRQAAFERHVVPELTVLLHVARTMTVREHDAEDLVQDTLLRAYNAIDRFDGSHPRAWLFTIMRNAQVNRTRRRRPELLDDPNGTDDIASGDATSPQKLVEERLFIEAVQAALGKLPPRMVQVVELIDFDGLTYPEAAEALGVPVGTVMSRLHRARRKIRDRLTAAGLAPRGERP